MEGPGSTLLLMARLGKDGRKGIHNYIGHANKLSYQRHIIKTINILSSIDENKSIVKDKCWFNTLSGPLNHCSFTISYLGRHENMISISHRSQQSMAWTTWKTVRAEVLRYINARSPG